MDIMRDKDCKAVLNSLLEGNQLSKTALILLCTDESINIGKVIDVIRNEWFIPVHCTKIDNTTIWLMNIDDINDYHLDRSNQYDCMKHHFYEKRDKRLVNTLLSLYTDDISRFQRVIDSANRQITLYEQNK